MALLACGIGLIISSSHVSANIGEFMVFCAGGLMWASVESTTPGASPPKQASKRSNSDMALGEKEFNAWRSYMRTAKLARCTLLWDEIDAIDREGWAKVAMESNKANS